MPWLCPGLFLPGKRRIETRRARGSQARNNPDDGATYYSQKILWRSFVVEIIYVENAELITILTSYPGFVN